MPRSESSKANKSGDAAQIGMVEMDLHEISEALKPWIDTTDEEERALRERAKYVYDRVLTSHAYIINAMNRIPDDDAASLQQDAVEALSALSMIEADIASLTIHDPHPNPGKISNFFIQRIKPLIASISKRLWRFISKYLTLKDWKVAGEVSGGVPALALGKVSLELRFGP
ncbi:hypothetical protein ACFY1P_21785 [Streptomyces sp. NPDC001407]|uniref:hypothetical protein n=1 Tax=unclassified Streptomyces TaxID=2593676 RepID=UPI0036BD2D7B